MNSAIFADTAQQGIVHHLAVARIYDFRFAECVDDEDEADAEQEQAGREENKAERDTPGRLTPSGAEQKDRPGRWARRRDDEPRWAQCGDRAVQVVRRGLNE
mgnify:CR=1 FL=1